MPTGCCSNCFSKYTFLNPENGCSSCAYSFCGKCVGYKAMMPRLANKPVSVCKKCYEKLEGEKNRPQNGNPSGESRPANWWGEGLPPPSLRNMIGHQPHPPRTVARPRVIQNSNAIITVEPLPEPENQDKEFEKRLEQLKQDESAPPSLSIEQIEERLAVLRGVDVELVRNPRLWFEKTASSSEGLDPHVALIKKAQDEAEIEMSHDKRLEERARALKDDSGREEGAPEVPPHASQSDEFVGATKEEMEQIKRLLEDAEKKNSSEIEKREKEGDDVNKEMKEALAAIRREKSTANEEAESDEESLDEETLKRIVVEAENTPDELDLEEKAPTEEKESPKKKGFLRKLFKK